MRARFASDFGGDLCPIGSGPLQHVMATTISGLSDARLYIGAITLALICRAGGLGRRDSCEVGAMTIPAVDTE